MSTKYPLYLRLWLWWLVTTAIYFVTAPVVGEFGPPFSWRTFLGLFVPFGPGNLVLIATLPYALLTILALGLFVYILFSVGKEEQASSGAIKSFLRRPIIKSLMNLGMLFAVTLAVDLITVHTWASLRIFLGTFG